MHIAFYVTTLLAATLTLLTLPVVAELVLVTLASLLPKLVAEAAMGSREIKLAVLIPAHNEELLIASCVESLRSSAGGDNTRIIAVAHNCSDRTAVRARNAGAEVLVLDEPMAEGKGAALAAGFAYATAQGMDATLVVDADATVSRNLVSAVRHAMANGADAVQCRYEMDSSSKHPATRLTALAFRGFNVVRPTGRDRLGLSAGILGNGFAVGQSILAENPYRSLSVVEDLEFHLHLVLSGKRVHFLEQAKVSSALPWSKQGEASQRSRWEGGRLNAAQTWLLPLLKQLLRGRLRVVEPMLDLLSLPIGYATFLLLLGLCFPLAWLRVYALFAIIAIACHVLRAAASGADFAGDLRILARTPGYMLWKLRMVPALLRGSRRDAAWVRTERDAALPEISRKTTSESKMAPKMEPKMEPALHMSGSLEIS